MRLRLRAPADAPPRCSQPVSRAFLPARRGGRRAADQHRRRLAPGRRRATRPLAPGPARRLHRRAVLRCCRHSAPRPALVLPHGTSARIRSLFPVCRQQSRQRCRPARVSVRHRTAGRNTRAGARMDRRFRRPCRLHHRLRRERVAPTHHRRVGDQRATTNVAPPGNLVGVQRGPLLPPARRDRPYQHRHRLGAPAVGRATHPLPAELRQCIRAPPAHPIPAGGALHGLRTCHPRRPVSLA